MKSGMALVLCAVFTVAAFAGEPAEETLQKVRKKYESITDAQLKFSQKTTFGMAKLEQQTTGTLLLKKDHKYRVEVEGQTVVTDGQTVWSYSAPNNRVLIDHFKVDERSLSPERILTGASADFVSSVLGKENVGKNELTVLKLVPKEGESLIASLKLWVDEKTWMIRRVELLDVNDKQTVYTVNDIKTNVGLLDSRFTYQIPQGVEVVDLR